MPSRPTMPTAATMARIETRILEWEFATIPKTSQRRAKGGGEGEPDAIWRMCRDAHVGPIGFRGFVTIGREERRVFEMQRRVLLRRK